ncbi:MAG: hypothetical protein A2992_02295 [Elusimicrobia bacterium RIFCSPLOWO2_01_FULL_59_12]|nr:MAG: hypothetical protein A2992_02295 [Elusimicrobia bacterium RIFCSPLOWO2_01_FULL_59_12]
MPSFVWAQVVLTVVHPTEGQQLPALRETFILGEATPGSTVTVNGAMLRVHPKGGYLAMVPLQTGPLVLSVQAVTPGGETAKVDRRVVVAEGWTELPAKPFTLKKETLEPMEDIVLSPGDPLRVFFQGTPQASGEFSVEGVMRHVPMSDRATSAASTGAVRGLYEGTYIIQPDDEADKAPIEVVLKNRKHQVRAKTRGRLTIDTGKIPRVGVITEDVAALRTGAEGGYDLFLYKGMRVQLTGRVRGQRRVRLSSLQSGWIKDASVQELPRGTPVPRSHLNNIVLTRKPESTLIRVPLEDVLPYRTEQSLDPAQLTVTLYGAVNKTDLIRYDPADTLIRQVRWKQISRDTCQILIEPAFKTWWGYDVRYEGTTLMIEVRKPWTRAGIKGMTIAVDPGHGGSELGAIGPHGTLEKDANLEIARALRDALESAGARVTLTRNSDIDIPLYERSRIAWNNQAQLFISIHCNAAGPGENPLLVNGYSVYWYHPQSQALARAVHAQYGLRTRLPDRGLFYADFAVNRMTQMPAILTEQAYLIVPEQELLIFSPAFQRTAAQSILNGILAFLQPR